MNVDKVVELVERQIKHLTFGFEVESLPFDPEDSDDFHSMVRDYNFRIHRDNSVDESAGGQEYVSPIYDMTAIRDGILYAHLRDLLPEVRVTKRAGVHIHVGFDFLRAYDDSEEDARKLMRYISTLWVENESFFVDEYAGRWLSRRKWCKKLTHNDHIATMRNVLNDYRRFCQYTGVRDNRYKTLNLCSYTEHGTVEFRTFNSTTSAIEILDEISLCLSVVAYSYAYMMHEDKFPSLFVDLGQFKAFWANVQEMMELSPAISQDMQETRKSRMWV